MADDLDDGEFWLPPQFLCDETEKKKKKNMGSDHGLSLPCEFPYGFGSLGPHSDLSSPVGSVMGSTETESDEEDLLAGLTRQMAHSMLDTRPNKPFYSENPKPKERVSAGSPQSTLCSSGNGYGLKRHSQVVSPPETVAPVVQNSMAWDLLCAAAGEVARMRMNEEGFEYYHHNRGLLVPPARKPTLVSPHEKTHNTIFGFHSNNHPLSHHQFQTSQFQQLKRQQSSVSWGGQAKVTGQFHAEHAVDFVGNRNGRPLDLSSSTAWPPLQQQHQPSQQRNGSGMRAVFLGGGGARRESSGTGVFLPRRIGTNAEPRKKPACSTVLLPARVVQALNLNVDEMSAQHNLYPRFNGSLGSENDSVRYRSGNGMVYQQKRNFRSSPVTNPEFRLPPEWTY